MLSIFYFFLFKIGLLHHRLVECRHLWDDRIFRFFADGIWLDLFFDICGKSEVEFRIFIRTFFERFFVFDLLLLGIEKLGDVEVDLSGLFVAFLTKDEDCESSLYIEALVLFFMKTS